MKPDVIIFINFILWIKLKLLIFLYVQRGKILVISGSIEKPLTGPQKFLFNIENWFNFHTYLDYLHDVAIFDSIVRYFASI